LLTLLDNLNAYISATQLGITMASLALGWVGEGVFAHLLEAPLEGVVSEVTLHTLSFAIAFSIITFLHIVLGELAPKTLALERAETFILDGMLAVRDANKHFGLALTEDGRYTTIAGYLLDKAGRLLRPGDRVEDVAGVFSVERVENRRISRVRFSPSEN
jgi:CBS domain containing-hemolysin-like protein